MKRLIFILPIVLLSCKKEDIKPFEFPKINGNSSEIKLDGSYLLQDALLYISENDNKLIKNHFSDTRVVSRLKPNSFESFDSIIKNKTIWTFKSPTQNFQYGEFTVKNNGIAKSLTFYVTPSNWTIDNKPIVNAKLINIKGDTIVEFTTYVQRYNDESYHFSVLKFKKIN